MSFESEMRRRRFARCLLRADLALDDGCVDDAREALDEARQLRPQAPEIAALEERLSECRTPATAPPAHRIPDDFTLSTAGITRRTWPVPLLVIVLTLVVSGVFGAWIWRTDGPDVEPAGPPVVLSPTLAAAPAAPASHRPMEVRIEHETIAAPQVVPRIAGDDDRPVLRSAPIADAAPAAVPEAVTAAATRTTERTPARLPPPLAPRAEARPEFSRPLTPAPEPLVRSAVSTSSPPVMPPTPAAASTPVATAGSTPPVENPDARPAGADVAGRAEARGVRTGSPVTADDDSVGVRAVLSRYETAYSSLDAAAASAVWPGVNRTALARAFRDLASQQVSLGSCDVTVKGTAARASCAGTATWEPRIGGGLRREARRWDFELRRAGDGWQIERATARTDGD